MAQNFCQLATSLISLSHVDLLVCDEWNHLPRAWFVLCVSAELLTVIFLEQISIKRLCSVYTNLLFWLQKFSSSSDTRSRRSLFARWNANWGRRKSTSKARAAAGTASTAHSIRYKWQKIEIILCLFAIFPLARSVMLINFHARGATECLCALQWKMIARSGYRNTILNALSVLLYGKFSSHWPFRIRARL